ncbi:MAG: hypothetical protein WBW49_14550, partial [Candidatus Acidiferrum sp.]
MIRRQHDNAIDWILRIGQVLQVAFLPPSADATKSGRRSCSQLVENLVSRWNGYAMKKWGHMLYTEANYHNFLGRVQLFAGPGVNQYVHTVRLGNNPSKIDY